MHRFRLSNEKIQTEQNIPQKAVIQIEITTKLSLSVVFDYHSCCWLKDTPKCIACVDQRNLIEVLVNEANELTLKNKLLKRKSLCYVCSNKSCFTYHKIKVDAKMNFYTGILTKEMFNVIFTLTRPYLLNIVYWTAPAKHRVTSTRIKKHSVTKTSKKLTQRDEFLSTHMRLRLGIPNEDLADGFCISPALYSGTLTTWIRLLRQLL